MKIVTICGSMRFQNEMLNIARDLEAKFGWCVLQSVYDFEGKGFSEQEYKNIADAHFEKINLSDMIYVANVGGYIGSSTKGEIDYAKRHNIKVVYHTDYFGEGL